MRSAIHKDLPPNTGDFRLMSRPVVQAPAKAARGAPIRPRHGHLAGLSRRRSLSIDRLAAAGETKYPLHKMLGVRLAGIRSFSGLPLRIALGAGTWP